MRYEGTPNEIMKQLGKSYVDITRIYHGKNHECRCGCKGKYYDRRTADGRRSRGFNMAINALMGMDWPCYLGKDDVTPTYINFPYDEINDKCYCVYFD